MKHLSEMEDLHEQWRKQEVWRVRFIVLSLIVLLGALCKLSEHIHISFH